MRISNPFCRVIHIFKYKIRAGIILEYSPIPTGGTPGSSTTGYGQNEFSKNNHASLFSIFSGVEATFCGVLPRSAC
jgi:hypothetical protein